MSLLFAQQVASSQIGSQGMQIGDLAIGTVAGLVGYACLATVLPKQGIGNDISSTIKKIPIIGSIWGIGSGANTLTEAFTSFSWMFGLAGYMITFSMTKNSSYALLASFGGGGIVAVFKYPPSFLTKQPAKSKKSAKKNDLWGQIKQIFS